MLFDLRIEKVQNLQASSAEEHHFGSSPDEEAASLASAFAAQNVLHPAVVAKPVTDPSILDQTRVFEELCRQTQPIAQPGSASATTLAKIISEDTARSTGLTVETAERQVTTSRPIETLINGRHPTGKAAEVVAASDYRALHEGSDPGIVNSPKKVATNVKDIRLAPDAGSKKDLLFAFEAEDGRFIWKHNGQVKTGGGQYVADSLVEMAKTPGCGKVAYVDARYVNPDGTPRVAPDAFTEAQAKKLHEAGVRLRGIPDLEQRAADLVENINKYKEDGLTPEARKQLETLRDDIATAYEWKGVMGRMAGGAAIGAASAAILSLVVQLATEGKVDIKALGKATGTGAAFGAAGAAVDAGFYHLATKILELPPEAAKEFAQNGVATGFCLIAIGVDLSSEIRSLHEGNITTAGFVAGGCIKTALDLLPLVIAPLGLVSLPILVGSQMGGRWLIAKVRARDQAIKRAVAEDMALVAALNRRLLALGQTIAATNAECDATDELFRRVMGEAHSTFWNNQGQGA